MPRSSPPPAQPTAQEQQAAALAQQLAGLAGVPSSSAPSWFSDLPPDQQKAVMDVGRRTYGADWNPAYASQAAVSYLLQQTGQHEVYTGETIGTYTRPAGTILGAKTGLPPITKPITKDVTVPGTSIDAARAAAPASAPYLQVIVTVAAKYGVPWQLVWGVIRHESNFDPAAVGDGGKSHGLAQVYQPAHPDISTSQANDPKFAIDFVARNLAANFSKFHDWGLAVLAHNSPLAAQTIFSTGMSAPKRAPFDKAYLTGVFADLDKLGYDFRDVKQDALDGAISAGSSAGSAVVLPDPVATRQKASDYLRGLYFREPTADEVEQLVGVINGAVTQNAVNKAAPAANPFAPGADHAGDGMVNPLPGAKTTGHFGESRPGHTHAGVDLAAPEGTPTFAAVAGYVEYHDDPKGFGTYVVLRGDDGRRYTYGHLSARVAANGSHIAAGAIVGRVGSTGHSTGPHLHFQIENPDGHKVNPEPELAGATALADEAEVQSGALATQTELDPQARMIETIQQSAEYKRLYGNKPAGVTEQDYAQRFVGEGQALLGYTPPGEAVRAGLASGQEGVTAGFLAGTPEASRSSTFRQRLFKQASLFNALT